MIHRAIRVILGTFFFCILFVSVSLAQSRETMSLDGVWNFATDPDSRGETEKWYEPTAKLPAMPLPGYAPEAKGTIRVPGIWDNQGYGVETDKVRHNFVGKGWYKRQVEIPRSWAGRRAFLLITGVSRYAKVWIDDHFLGEHIGYLSVQQYDVTQYAVPGKTATITIQVDSKQRWEVDAMYGCSSLADFMDIEWGGIWGHVRLEARSNAWLSDLFVQPDVAKSSCITSAILNGKTDLADAAKLEIFDQSGRCVAEALLKINPKAAVGEPIAVKAAIPDAELWTPDSPTLYTARLSLISGKQALDAVESRFGMRQFTIDGHHFLLNGKRIMLRGCGDDHIYPEQMSMPSDKALHLSRLRTIKSYGFNHVRHHSTMMPPEYYEACDEVGMIVNAEFPICYSHLVPGTGAWWKQRAPKDTDPGPANETFKQQWAAAIKRHRNHPSILCWVMGNELWDGIPLRYDFQRIARELDPGRFFIDSDGVWGDDFAVPGSNILVSKKDRDTLDFYILSFNVFTNPIDNPTKYETPQPMKPAISHEAGNYVTFSRPDLIDEFKHNIKPFWLTAGKAKLEKLGLLQEANAWAEKSERLCSLLHKYELESLRKNPCMSGYHWWLFQDYWTSSNGLVDHYFRPKSIAKEEVLKINNEVVLLESGLEHTYRGKARLDAKLLISNYSPQPLQGKLIWEVKAGDQTVSKQQVPLNLVPQGEVAEMALIGVELPEVTSPTQLKITTEVVANGKRYTNDWSARLYPSVIAPAALPAPVFADETQINLCKTWGVKPVPARSDLDSHAVYVVSWPCDPRIVDAMNRGASVVILDGVDLLMKSYPVTFRTSWWKAGDAPQANHTGTLVYDHPVTRAMAPDGWCDDGWFHLIEGGKKYVLESAPARPEVIIRALTSMVRVEDEALLFEVGVGKGRVIVSGLNHRRAEGRPENEWLIVRLLEHAAQFTQPKAKWPASFLEIVSVAPDGSLPGFRQLVANDGLDITWYSFREDKARVLSCQQTKPGNRVTWKTAPVPKKSASDRITFVFAGGLGYSSEPKTEGFALEINGKEVLRFDLPEPKTWQSADKRVELRFESRRTVSVDQFGLFHLTVPRDMLKPGEPCVLGVRSLGNGSQRWFGLNPYW